MRMTKRQRVAKATERMEYAALDMIRTAECYGSRTDETGRRRDVLEKARRYAASVDALSRVRSRKVTVRQPPAQ